MPDLNSFRKEMNFRDIGGYKTKDGKKIKPAMIYRSGALGLMNEQEISVLKELKIRTILDLRSKKGSLELPDPDIDNCDQHCMCAAMEDLGDDLNDSPSEFYQMLIDEDQKGNLIATIASSYHASLVYSNEAYRFMFKILLDKKVPLLLHCSQGKDRTGIAVILIMLALGIDEEDIIHDFLLSNEYRRSFIDKRMNDLRLLVNMSNNIRTAVQAYEGVIPEEITMILAEIKERYNTYENFLFHEYDLKEEDLIFLQSTYLE